MGEAEQTLLLQSFETFPNTGGWDVSIRTLSAVFHDLGFRRSSSVFDWVFFYQ
jgi:hypothetical protein